MSEKDKIIQIIDLCILDLEYLKDSFDKGSNYYLINSSKIKRYRKVINERLMTAQQVPKEFRWKFKEVEE